MATSKFKTFCRIIDYLDVNDGDLASLIRGTCVDQTINSMRGKSGITLLIPDKAYRAKIEKLAYSDKTEDAIQAQDMLNAIVFRDVFKTPSDWKSKDVVNCLNNPQFVEVASTTSTEVVFKSGAKAVLDSAFKDASKRSNLAVWKLTGEIPVTTDAPAPRYAPIRKKVTGSYEVDVRATAERFKIALAVENAYALSHANVAYQPNKDSFVDAVYSLINYALNVRKDSALVVDKILPMLAFDKIDFYILVEPHRRDGKYLIDDGLINEWWLNRLTTPCDCEALFKQIESLMAPGAELRAKITDAIAAIRENIILTARPRGAVDMIAMAYNEIESDNTIGGVGPVYPDELANYYRADPGLKLIHDELRYLTYGAFRKLETGPFDYGRFREIVDVIGDCLVATTEDRPKAHRLLNRNTIKYMISPSEKLSEIKIFLFSTMFMHIALTSAEASNYKYKHSMARPDPDNVIVFNIAKELHFRHKRIIGQNGVQESDVAIIDALKSLNVDTLDPVLREEIRKRFA